MKFPWAKNTTLIEAVKQGIPAQFPQAVVEEAKRQLRVEARARKEARQAEAEARQVRAAVKA